VTLEIPDDVSDARAERSDVLGVHAREHCDPQLISTKFAIGISVHDPVRPKDFRNVRRVDVVIKVDRSDDVAAKCRILDEGSGEGRRFGPGVEDFR